MGSETVGLSDMLSQMLPPAAGRSCYTEAGAGTEHVNRGGGCMLKAGRSAGLRTEESARAQNS
jgi:hypothetical protein